LWRSLPRDHHLRRSDPTGGQRKRRRAAAQASKKGRKVRMVGKSTTSERLRHPPQEHTARLALEHDAAPIGISAPAALAERLVFARQPVPPRPSVL